MWTSLIALLALSAAAVDGLAIDSRDTSSSADLPAPLHKRSRVLGTELAKVEALQETLGDCEAVAQAAADYARDATKVNALLTFFNDSSNILRERVATVFEKIAADCRGETSFVTHHTDDSTLPRAPPSGGCRPSPGNPVPVAYAQNTGPNRGSIVYCDGFYARDAQASGCGRSDKSLVMIHEMTHVQNLLDQLNQLSTTDIERMYGYVNAKYLAIKNPRKAKLNADNYAFYAQAVEMACADPKSG